MFVYENGNSLNITFKGNTPVENPELVIKGYKNGASLTMNGTTYGVKNGEEFEGRAKTFVYQKDGKLNITFRGIEGMNDPEVVLDETSDGVVNALVSGASVVINYTEDGVSAGDATEPEVIIPDVKGDPVEEEEIPDPVEPEDESEELEGEGDSMIEE